MLQYIQKIIIDSDGIITREKQENLAPDQEDNNPAENGNRVRYAI